MYFLACDLGVEEKIFLSSSPDLGSFETNYHTSFGSLYSIWSWYKSAGGSIRDCGGEVERLIGLWRRSEY